MNPLLMLKLGGAAAIVLALYGGYKYIEHGGYTRGKAEIQGKLDALQAKVDVVDLQTRAANKLHKENFDELKQSNKNRVSRLNAYYERMLRPQTGDDSPALSASGIDATSREQGASGCGFEFERACALDANKIDAFQQWVIKNNIPVE